MFRCKKLFNLSLIVKLLFIDLGLHSESQSNSLVVTEIIKSGQCDLMCFFLTCLKINAISPPYVVQPPSSRKRYVFLAFNGPVVHNFHNITPISMNVTSCFRVCCDQR